MTEYDKQADAFLQKTGAKIEARFKTLGQHFGGDDKKRDVYEIRISRGSRAWAFEYGDSIQNTEARLERTLGKGNASFFLADRSDVFDPYGFKVKKLKAATTALEAWDVAGKDGRPSAYDVLACLTKSEPADNVDDFAADFGYMKPSEALRVFKAVKKEWQEVQKLFTDEEIELMQEIA
jgi:hypothetical protein